MRAGRRASPRMVQRPFLPLSAHQHSAEDQAGPRGCSQSIRGVTSSTPRAPQGELSRGARRVPPVRMTERTIACRTLQLAMVCPVLLGAGIAKAGCASADGLAASTGSCPVCSPPSLTWKASRQQTQPSVRNKPCRWAASRTPKSGRNLA